jgi:hypothetical protein
MNRTIAVIAAAIAVNFAVAGSASAGFPETRAQEAAAEGSQALRSFIHRTRMIYALNIQDFTVTDEAAEVAEPIATPADEALRAEREQASFREQIYRDMLHE